MDKLELLHLKFLKWSLGVHKKASNTGCYGDTGRVALACGLLPQGLKYFFRVAAISGDGNNTLVGKAYAEQKDCNLTWYRTWNQISSQSAVISGNSSSLTVNYKLLEDKFLINWKVNLLTQSKLSFYRQLKDIHDYEPYLDNINFQQRKHISRLRVSAHDLNVEIGRYNQERRGRLAAKACRFCCDGEILAGFEQLPFFEDPVLETEEHALSACPEYSVIRKSLSKDLQLLLEIKDYNNINESHAKELGKFLSDCFLHRHPEKKNPGGKCRRSVHQTDNSQHRKGL